MGVYRAIRDDERFPSNIVELDDIKILQHILEREKNSLKELLEDGEKK